MRNTILFASLASLLLTACGEKEITLTPQQVAIAAELEKAPPSSLIIFNDDASVEWGIICPDRYKGRITTAVIGFVYTWRCGSPNSIRGSMTAKQMATLVDRIIVPSDPSYAGSFKTATLEMML